MAGESARSRHISIAATNSKRLSPRAGITPKWPRFAASQPYARLHFARRWELNSLGDATAGARNHIAGEPFVVLLGDTLIEPDPPVTRLMIELFERLCTPVAALEEVPLLKVHRYGIVAGREIEPGLFRIDDLIEKPDPDAAPSNPAIAGRYLLTPDIFDDLDTTSRGRNNAVHLPDALCTMVQLPTYGLRLPGRLHDIGNRLDVLKTTMLYVLRRPDLRADFAAWPRDLAAELPARPTLPTDAGKDATGLAFGDARLL